MFIVFDGVDGSGKTTQFNKFVKYLFAKHKHNHLVLTREPYQETDIRKLLYAEDDPLTQSEKLAELFVADRKKHADELIVPCVEKGLFVISDRYKHSTIAYQTAQGMDMQKLIEMHENLPVPAITFIIDVSIDEAFRRMAGDEGRKSHKFEKNRDFMEKVRENFRKEKEALSGEKVFVIDGERNPDEIFREIKEIFEREANG